MTEKERLAFNAKLKLDRENGYITVKWQKLFTADGEEIECGGFSSWGFGHEKLDPNKYDFIYLQFYGNGDKPAYE
jgi:hypothetical protein